MKKSIIAAALFCFAYAHAQNTVIVQSDWNTYTGNSSYTTTYNALGFSKGTQYGTFDIYAQSATTQENNQTIDRMGGLEIGWSKIITVGKGYFLPRYGIGFMNSIDPMPGVKIDATYSIFTIEYGQPVFGGNSIFASYGHTIGMNKDAISSTNRFILGMDFPLNEEFTLRFGVSHMRQINTIQNGVTVNMFYSF